MGEFDSHDPLWKLLGRAKPAEASPFFAAKVMRAIEAAPDENPHWLVALLFRRIVPVAACAAIALLALSGVSQKTDGRNGVAAVDRVVDFDTIANLDLLAASADASLWLSDPTSTRP